MGMAAVANAIFACFRTQVVVRVCLIEAMVGSQDALNVSAFGAMEAKMC